MDVGNLNIKVSKLQFIDRYLNLYFDNIEYKVPPTIDDPMILQEIKDDLLKHNIIKD